MSSSAFAADVRDRALNSLFDEVVSALAGQSALGTPWESCFALTALRTTLDTAERTMHAMGTASAESLALAGAEARARPT